MDSHTDSHRLQRFPLGSGWFLMGSISLLCLTSPPKPRLRIPGLQPKVTSSSDPIRVRVRQVGHRF
jgi:hypothetical protein